MLEILANAVIYSPLLMISTIIICALLWRYFSGRRVSQLIDKIPGPKAYPIIGNLLNVAVPTTEILNVAMNNRKQFGPILRLWIGSTPIVSLSKAEYIETILSNTEEIRKSFAYQMIAPWLGNGLLTSFGERWFKHRKMITPTFHFKILDTFIPSFESNSQILIGKLEPYAKNGKVFDVYPFVTRCALDIICETAMGTSPHAQESQERSPYVSAIYRLSHLISLRFQRFYLHSDAIYYRTKNGKESMENIKILHNFTESVIRERKEKNKKNIQESIEEDSGIKKRKAFLDLLLDAGGNLTDTDLREEVDTFMFEGHDTTTTGMSWAIYLLGRHPEIQESVAEEILSLWPKGTELTMQALNDMKLLERVIKEALRLFPSVPFFSRTLSKDLKFGEYLVPASTTITASSYLLHRDENVFPNPEKFDPDRFLAENVRNRHPYAYIPFSAGSRNCIGQKFAILEEKTVLASIFRAYKIKSIDSREDIQLISELILRPKDGVRITITPRE